MKQTIIILAGLGFIGYALYMVFAKEEPTKSYKEYKAGADEAREEGKEVIDVYREEELGVIGKYVTENFEWEHNKMILSIANGDYSACVLHYKGSHHKPDDGWERTPYDFCSDAINNKEIYMDPVVKEIVDEGSKVAITPTDVSEGEKVHPDAYSWIKENLNIGTTDSHFLDYQKGWVDARLQGFHETDTNFYDKVMEYAGMKERSIIWTPWRQKEKWSW